MPLRSHSDARGLHRPPKAVAACTSNHESSGGAALDWLDAAIARGEPPFDLVFIDADKEHSRDYVKRALTLSRPGTVIVVDNVVREGRVADVDCPDAGVQGIRRMLEWIGARPDLAATALQTIDAKGHDGFLLAVVRGGDGGTRID